MVVQLGQHGEGRWQVHPRGLAHARQYTTVAHADSAGTAGWSSGSKRWQTEAMESRFLQLSDVAAELNVSDSQVYHLVRSGELPAIKIGGRGQWRVERAKLEEYVQARYAETAAWVRENPLIDRDGE
jgi:excisionase family DNA binding protein